MKAVTVRRAEGGATLVEFALASSILVLLLGGIFDLGLAMHNYTLLQHVTDTATRQIAARLNLRPQCGQIRRYLDTTATPQLRDTMGIPLYGDHNWSMQWDLPDDLERPPNLAGEYPVMRIRGWFSSGCYFLCRFTPDAFRVSASSEIVIERPKVNCKPDQF